VRKSTVAEKEEEAPEGQLRWRGTALKKGIEGGTEGGEVVLMQAPLIEESEKLQGEKVSGNEKKAVSAESRGNDGRVGSHETAQGD